MRDGTTNIALPSQWPEKLRQVWKVQVGEGHSSPVVSGNRVFQFSRQGDNEVAAAYDLASGKQVWKDEYPAPYRMNIAAHAHGKGPKSTSVVADGRLFTLGISGILSAYDSQSGKMIWRKAFKSEYKSTSPDFGTAASPLVDGKQLIAFVGGDQGGALTAFDTATGAVKWAWNGEGPAYASPIVVEIDGKRHVITNSEKQLVSVSAADGGLLWSLPLKTPYTQNAVTPLWVNGLIVYSGLDNPATGLKVKWAGKWDVEKAWETKEASMYMSSPVPRDAVVYGFTNRNKGQLFALDAASGKVVWTGAPRQGDNASLIAAGQMVLVLTTEANLLVYRVAKPGLELLRQYKVSDTDTWAYPALTPEGILVKDKESLALWSAR